MSKDLNDHVRATAVNMLRQGLDIKLISQVTGLSIEEIQKLQAITRKD